MPLVVDGFGLNYKVPTFAAQIIFGAGRITAAALTLAVLLAGMKTAAGDLTVDLDVKRVSTTEEINLRCGVGSQLARGAYKAILVEGVDIYVTAVTAPAGTAATVAFVIGGSWSTPGSWTFRIGGDTVTGDIAASASDDTVGAAMVVAINAKTALPFTAAYVAGTNTLTLTCKNLGVQGKDWLVAFDSSAVPSGFTFTLTGSAAAGTGRVRAGAAASGTGTEDVTTLLTRLQTVRYARIAAAQNDATNAALWESHVNSKAAATKLLLESVVFGANAAYATAQSLAQTTLNAVRAQVLWARNSESHPFEIAAANAALRAATESEDPNPDYDGKVLLGIAAQQFDGDSPTDTEQDTALNNGVTPVATVNGEAKIVRSITTYCLNGSDPDYRVIDIGYQVFPDYATLDLKLEYETVFRPANPRVGPDPTPEQFEPPPGVGFPRLWSDNHVHKKLREYFDAGWIEQPTTASVVSEYNKTSKRIMSAVEFTVRPIQHQLGQIVRQVNNS